MIDPSQRDRILQTVRERVILMGILNVTPDSFSDGGRHDTPEAALAQARRMVADGAGILDIGGESTRPGAVPVPEAEEIDRVLPILRKLKTEMDVPLSIDTVKASVARAAVAAGAVIINDVTGLRGDPEMARVVADTGAAVVITYNLGKVAADIGAASDMHAFFDRALAQAEAAGVPKGHIWLDPGIGFAKTQDQNVELIARLDTLALYGLPVLAGLSRKSFLGHVTGRPVGERLAGTIAANLMAVYRGARILRVHDVAEHADALKVHEAIEGRKA